nr:MAG TPA: hypothetical protein [Caudoviricetes sp.]
MGETFLSLLAPVVAQLPAVCPPRARARGPPGVNAGAPARTRATAGWHKLS